VPYNKDSLKELKIMIKDAITHLDKSEKNVRDINILDSVDEFIKSKYVQSVSNNVPVDILRKDFIKFMGEYDITPHKFGRVMTTYISSDKNTLGIRRIAIRSGGAYGGIRRRKETGEKQTTTVEPIIMASEHGTQQHKLAPISFVPPPLRVLQPQEIHIPQNISMMGKLNPQPISLLLNNN